VFRTPNAPFVRVVDPRSIFSGASTLASLPEGCLSFLAAGVCSRSALPVHSRGWGGGSTCVPGAFRAPNATFVRVLDPRSIFIRCFDLSFPPRGLHELPRSWCLQPLSSARPLAWLGRGKHLRARSVSYSQRNICNGCWTRVPIHSGTTPSSVSGSLVTPPDRQRTAGIHAAVAPRTTLGGYPTGRNHHWCFSFTSKCRVTREGSSTVMPLSGTPTVGELDSPVRARLP